MEARDGGGSRTDGRILDSYHAERWPVGRTLLRATDRLFGPFAKSVSGNDLVTSLRGREETASIPSRYIQDISSASSANSRAANWGPLASDGERRLSDALLLPIQQLQIGRIGFRLTVVHAYGWAVLSRMTGAAGLRAIVLFLCGSSRTVSSLGP